MDLGQLLFNQAIGGSGGGGANIHSFTLVLPTDGWTKDEDANWYTQSFEMEGITTSVTSEKILHDVDISNCETDSDIQELYAGWQNVLDSKCIVDGYLWVKISQPPTTAINTYGWWIK